MAFDFPDSPAVNDVFDTGTGVSYKWDGTAWRVDTGLVPLPTITRVITYSGAGTYNYVPPAGLRQMQVELWGSGGGGGGAATTAATTLSAAGGGGGGGFVRKLYQASELASSEPLVLGAGGAGGAAGANNGATGASSTFKGLTATGGGGGVGSSATATVGGVVGRGAQGAGSGGDFNSGGRSGDQGVRFYHNGAGQAAPGYGGSGVDFPQFQPLPTTTTTNWDPAPGGANARIGCGGNGAALRFTQTQTPGAAGGDGQAIITETLWDPDYVATAPLLSRINVVQYPLAGSFSYVKPAGLKYLQVEIWGAGGGSGGSAATAAAQVSASGGGGGGGYVRKLYAAGDLAASESLVNGVGGAGGNGTSATNGSAGGVSSFKALTVSGGGGGQHSTPSANFGTRTRGTAGYGSGGDVNAGGNSGHYGHLNFPTTGWVQSGMGGGGYSHAQFFNAASQGNQASVDIGLGVNSGGNGVARIASQVADNGAKGGDGYATFTEYF